MHDDYYKMTGCMRAVSVYFMTRRRDGTLRTSGGPSAAVRSYATQLDDIADALLQIGFDLEAAESVYRKAWSDEKTRVFNAIRAVHTAAGSASKMPAAGGVALQRLTATFDRAVTNPGDGADGHAFLDAISIAIADTERAVQSSAPFLAVTGRVNATVMRLKDILSILKQAQDAYDDAFSTMRTNLMGQAGAFVRHYPRLQSQVTPWSTMDERLRQLMDFINKSADAGRGGGTGGNSTPSWGTVATSGSSSTSTSPPPSGSSS